MSVRFAYAFFSIIIVPGGIVNVPVAIVGVGGEQHQNARKFFLARKYEGVGDQEVQPVKAHSSSLVTVSGITRSTNSLQP